jgi:DNA-directed RNA polymerase subunit beta
MNRKDKETQFSKKKKFSLFFSRNYESSMNSLFLTKAIYSSALFFSKKEATEKSTNYILQKYQRSNQDTLIFQRPLVREGEWIQSGDILADCSTSLGGELSLGKNIFIAYMPWEGYNYEDAILISQRLVTEDVYTSIHIESYEVETRSTKFGKEQITKNIPEIPESQLSHLDERGIVKRGTSVKEGDILVGKVTPVQKKFISPYEKLLYTILEKELIPMRDSSLRTPKGLKAKVLEVKILNFSTQKVGVSKKKKVSFQPQDSSFQHSQTGSIGTNTHFFNESFPKKAQNGKTHFSFFVPSFSKKKKILKRKQNLFSFFVQNQKKSENFSSFQKPLNQYQGQKNPFSHPPFHFTSLTVSTPFANSVVHPLLKTKAKTLGSFVDISYGDDLYGRGHSNQNPFLIRSALRKKIFSFKNQQKKNNEFVEKPEKVQVYLVEKRKIQVGDKMSGRHGNKGIVSQILPIPDMPFLPDGTPLDMVLNPLGVPSRMNVGQIYECILGLAAKYLQQYYRIQPFDEIYGPQASRSFTFSKLYEARQKTAQKWLFNPCSPGKIQIFDGRTGEPYENPVTVGISYILKLVHLVDDKIHARSTGPYSLVTQQPLKGRSKYGGQRLGEMEVWAIEAYGAAFVLLEMLTIKSDDISGRMTLWSNILLNMPIYIGTPESFKVLVCELQALCLDMGLYRLNKKGFLTQIEHLMQLP